MKKYCHDKSDVPTGPHWAVVEFSSYYVPGDERSRTCPGHGYPESVERKAGYIAFDNEEEWKEYLKEAFVPRSCGSPPNIVAFEVKKLASVNTSISID